MLNKFIYKTKAAKLKYKGRGLTSMKMFQIVVTTHLKKCFRTLGVKLLIEKSLKSVCRWDLLLNENFKQLKESFKNFKKMREELLLVENL